MSQADQPSFAKAMQPAARALYDAVDAELITRFVAERKQEYLHLDFIKLHPSGELPSADKRNLAIALSGFANSDGGVIVWGVGTKKADGIDAAAEAKPISNIRRARSALESLTGEAVSPLVDRVQHEEIPVDGDTGFLKTYVPASESGPHMALCGQQRYYKRAGDSFYRLEHFDVADMFGRRAKPSLTCTYQLSSPNKRVQLQADRRKVTVYHTSAVLRLLNTGRGIARFPSVELRAHDPYPMPGDPLDRRLSRRQSLRGDRAVVFAGGADVVVHVDSTIDVTTIAIHGVPEGTEEVPDLVVDYRIAAEGVAPKVSALKIAGQEILEKILEKP